MPLQIDVDARDVMAARYARLCTLTREILMLLHPTEDEMNVFQPVIDNIGAKAAAAAGVEAAAKASEEHQSDAPTSTALPDAPIHNP